MTDNLPPLMFGIWIPGKGWWKLPVEGHALERAYAEMRREIAEYYARRIIRHGAYVQPIDKQLELGEHQLLALEVERNAGKWRTRLWHSLKNWYSKVVTSSK